MSQREKILIVEDERFLAHFMGSTLKKNEYDVLYAKDGTQAKLMIASYCPDVILLDLGLPDMDGLEILNNTRKWSSMPIIVVSARTHEKDKVQALDMGADDYLTKPFGTAELLARIRTALRHTRTSSDNGDLARTGVLKIADLEVDYDRRQVTVCGRKIHLTQNEYRIVSLLGIHCGRVLTYDYIMKALWGPVKNDGNQILRVHMANIRRKIERNPAEPRYIITEVGVGYRMSD